MPFITDGRLKRLDKQQDVLREALEEIAYGEMVGSDAGNAERYEEIAQEALAKFNDGQSAMRATPSLWAYKSTLNKTDGE